jgi:hypothetical protein
MPSLLERPINSRTSSLNDLFRNPRRGVPHVASKPPTAIRGITGTALGTKATVPSIGLGSTTVLARKIAKDFYLYLLGGIEHRRAEEKLNRRTQRGGAATTADAVSAYRRECNNLHRRCKPRQRSIALLFWRTAMQSFVRRFPGIFVRRP